MFALLAVQLSTTSVASAGDHLVLDAALSGVSTEAHKSSAAAGVSLGARADLMRFYGSMEGQAVSADYWTGRVAGGLDLLHRVEGLDVELGLFSGAGGGRADPSNEVAPLAGAEVGLGVRVGRVGLAWRHRFELASEWESDRVRLSVDVHDRTRVFGQYTRLTPGPHASGRDGLGVGMALVF